MPSHEQVNAEPSIKYIQTAGALSVMDCVFLAIGLFSKTNMGLDPTALAGLIPSALIAFGLLKYNSRVAAVAMTLFGIMRAMNEMVSDSSAGRTPVCGWQVILAATGVIAAVQAFRFHRWKGEAIRGNEPPVQDSRGKQVVTPTTPIQSTDFRSPRSKLNPTPNEANGGAGVSRGSRSGEDGSSGGGESSAAQAQGAVTLPKVEARSGSSPAEVTRSPATQMGPSPQEPARVEASELTTRNRLKVHKLDPVTGAKSFPIEFREGVRYRIEFDSDFIDPGTVVISASGSQFLARKSDLER